MLRRIERMLEKKPEDRVEIGSILPSEVKKMPFGPQMMTA
jgi:hypothetical protein